MMIYFNMSGKSQVSLLPVKEKQSLFIYLFSLIMFSSVHRQEKLVDTLDIKSWEECRHQPIDSKLQNAVQM